MGVENSTGCDYNKLSNLPKGRIIMIKVTVWNEFHHEKTDENIKKVYPDGIHAVIADFLRSDDISVRTATLDDENCGITRELLDDTDVLIWWGHCRHGDVPDEVAELVKDAVLRGMGIIFLHSAHHSKPFRALMGTSCNLCWREDGDLERVWTVDPSHPIAAGIGKYFEIPQEEMYSEPFGIPEPDKLVFLGWYEGGEAFRAGCCWRRENGKVFYFQPGHESYPTYYIKEVQTVIRNAVYWAKGDYRIPALECPHVCRPGEEK